MNTWPRPHLPPPKKPLDVSAKDKHFCLSSAYSKSSLELLNIEDRRLAISFKGTLQKKEKWANTKKKSKKSKSKSKMFKKKSNGQGKR